MNWKEYKKIEKEMNKQVSKEFIYLKKYLLEELTEKKVGIIMGLSLYFQSQVPVEERAKIINKEKGEQEK